MKTRNVRRKQWDRWMNRMTGVVPRAYFRQRHLRKRP